MSHFTLALCLVLFSSLSYSVSRDSVESPAASDPAVDIPAVWLLKIKGVIGPASADYTVRGIETAIRSGATAVILQIDTPGGLDKSMRSIIRAILASPIPVIGYVAPGGARAASAGTYILYACHIAAMAPATNLGAATPVQLGAPGMPSMPQEPQDPTAPPTDGEQPQDSRQPSPTQKPAFPDSSMKRKIINDAAAYIQGLAQLRQRNAEWAEKAVREGVSLTAEQAASIQVIDFVSESVDQLLQQVNGRELTFNHRQITLNTAQATVHEHNPDWRSEFLAVITDPNVAYFLMLLGIYGLIFEFSNPGLGIPGVVGAICLLIALYAFQVLPISYAGLGLIILGIALMAAEAFAPSFGVLGIGGIIAFIVGSIILMDTDLPGYQIAMPVILGVAVASAALMIFILGLILRSRQRAVVTGLIALEGQVTTVESVHDNGMAVIRLQGELWQVDCPDTLQKGDTVAVKSAEGVVLKVNKQNL